MCAVLFDGPVGEQAWPEDGSVGHPLMELEVEEINLLQKVQEMIRANPGKAESLFERFWQILKEENKEDLMCFHCPPMLIDRDWNQMRVSLPPFPDSGSVKTIHKRGAGLRRKVGKKKKVSKGKKVAEKKGRGNMKSRKKQTGVEKPNKNSKLGKKEKQKEDKKNRKTKKASQKKKINKKKKQILKMKKTNQQRKEKQETRQRTKYQEKMEELNNCTSLWAKLTNVGLGMAASLQKQVTDFNLDKK